MCFGKIIDKQIVLRCDQLVGSQLTVEQNVYALSDVRYRYTDAGYILSDERYRRIDVGYTLSDVRYRRTDAGYTLSDVR